MEYVPDTPRVVGAGAGAAMVMKKNFNHGVRDW